MALKRIRRERRLTDEEAARYRQIRELIERDKPEIAAQVRARKAELKQVDRLFEDLRAAREAAGMSLADLHQRSGIDASMLSKLETGARSNFTLETAQRYAAALGKKILFTIGD
jgi:ribosome-binding protein aMBF1 (putative translation factor)